MTATLDTPPTGRHAAAAPLDPAGLLVADVHARAERQITSVHRLVAERDAAVSRAVRAEAEAAAQQRVNLELQRHLDEYNQDRRGYERRIADLEAQVDRLRTADTLVLPRYVETRRGGWRRTR